MTNAPHLILTALLMLAAFLVGATTGALLKSIALAVTRPRSLRSDVAADGEAIVGAALASPVTIAPQPPRIEPHETSETPVDQVVPSVPMILVDEPAISLAIPAVLPAAETQSEAPTVVDTIAAPDAAITDNGIEPTAPATLPNDDGATEAASIGAPKDFEVGAPESEAVVALADAPPAVQEAPAPPAPTSQRPVLPRLDPPEPPARGFAETMLAMTRGAVPTISTMPPLPPLPTYEQLQVQRRYAAMQPARKAGESAAGMAIADPRSRAAAPQSPPRLTVVPMAEVIPFPLSSGAGASTAPSVPLAGEYPASVAAAIIDEPQPAPAPVAKGPPVVVAVPFETDSAPETGRVAVIETVPGDPVVVAKLVSGPLDDRPVEQATLSVFEPLPEHIDSEGPGSQASMDAASSGAGSGEPVGQVEEAKAVAPATEAAPPASPNPQSVPPRLHTEPGTGLPLGLESTLAEAIGATMELAPPQASTVPPSPSPRVARRVSPPIALAAFDIVADDAPRDDAMDDLDLVPEFELVGFDIGPPAPVAAGTAVAQETILDELPAELSEPDASAEPSAEETALVADLAGLPAIASLDVLLAEGPEPIDLERMRVALADESTTLSVDEVAPLDAPTDAFVAGVAQALLGGATPTPAGETGAMRAIEGSAPPRRLAPRLVALTLDDGDDPAQSAVAASGAAVAAASRTANAIVADINPEPGRPAGLPAAREARADDLTHIIGVLPVIETALNRLGIFHFDQIAAWTDANVSWIESYLGLEGRVSRELWRLQARELAAARPTLRSAKK